jgi:hypothetical protein
VDAAVVVEPLEDVEVHLEVVLVEVVVALEAEVDEGVVEVDLAAEEEVEEELELVPGPWSFLTSASLECT